MAQNRKKLIAGNWKLHMSVHQASVLVHRLDEHTGAYKDVETVICPTFLALNPLHKEIDRKKFKLGAQNLYFKDEGAYTGEVSAFLLKDLVDYGIVGHSERRKHFDETDKDVAKKAAAAVRNEITPIVCIGEKQSQRQDGFTKTVVHDQLVAGLNLVTDRDIETMVVAYEPLWAIGSGDIAKPEDIEEVLKLIRKTIRQLYGDKAADNVRLLYGGSVTPEFVQDYLNIAEIDGFLVGGASLNWQQFSEIIKLTHEFESKSGK